MNAAQSVAEQIIAGLDLNDDARQPAADIEAEQYVLGALLTDPGALERVRGTISSADLYRHDHRLIFAAVEAVAASGATSDIVTVKGHLDVRGELDQAGGLAYLGELAHDCISTAGLEAWAEQIAGKARRRNIAALGAVLTERAVIPGENLDVLTADVLEALSTATRPTREPLLLSAGELLRNLRAPTMLIARRKPANSIGVEFGPWGLGKTVAEFSEALRVARGLPVYGQHVTGGPVVYVLAEGSAAPRLAAWQAHHRHSLADAQILFSRCAVPLLMPGQAELLRREIDAAACRWGAPPAAIYIDTVSRNFGNGDPDKGADMMPWIDAIDRHLRLPFGACITAIHHPGHMEKQRSRGSSALPAALDFEYRHEAAGDMARIVCTKARDFAKPPDVAYRIVEVPLDVDGHRFTSITIDEVVDPGEGPTTAGMGRAQRQALDLLRDEINRRRGNLERSGHDPEAARITVSEWRDLAMEAGAIGSHRNSFYKVRDALIERGCIAVNNSFVSVIAYDEAI